MDFIDIIIQSNQHQDCTFVVENWGILPNKLISGKNIDTQCTTTYTTFNFTYVILTYPGVLSEKYYIDTTTTFNFTYVILTYPGVLIEKYYIDTTTTFNFTCDSDISWSLEWEILLGSYTRFFFRFQIANFQLFENYLPACIKYFYFKFRLKQTHI